TRGEHILIVAHGNLIRLMMAILGDRKVTDCLHYDLFNASLTTAVIDSESQFRIQLVNCVHHLNPEDITSM
ncbi:MAG: histidine phosphatase family protein, partial [Planctomycetes bacterium]|nr:histidine phosphatase family protein [Planctomycetota bacterium]